MHARGGVCWRGSGRCHWAPAVGGRRGGGWGSCGHWLESHATRPVDWCLFHSFVDVEGWEGVRGLANARSSGAPRLARSGQSQPTRRSHFPPAWRLARALVWRLARRGVTAGAHHGAYHRGVGCFPGRGSSRTFPAAASSRRASRGGTGPPRLDTAGPLSAWCGPDGCGVRLGATRVARPRGGVPTTRGTRRSGGRPPARALQSASGRPCVQ